MPENSTHKCTNAVNNVQSIRSSSHMAKILSVYNRLQAGDCENGNGGKRRVSRLTQFIHATLQLLKVARHLYDSQVGLEMNQTHYSCKSPSVCKHSHFAAKNIYINFCWSTIDLRCPANSQNGQIMQGSWSIYIWSYMIIVDCCWSIYIDHAGWSCW